MDVEYKDAPACCKQSTQRIKDILDAGNLLSDVLTLAPDLTVPRPNISKLGLIWAIGKATFSWGGNKKLVNSLVTPIVRGNIKKVIDLEIVKHNASNERELEKHWTTMKKNI